MLIVNRSSMINDLFGLEKQCYNIVAKAMLCEYVQIEFHNWQSCKSVKMNEIFINVFFVSLSKLITL